VHAGADADKLSTRTTVELGDPKLLQKLEGGSAKYSDATINDIRTSGNDETMGYRSTSNDLSLSYFHPASCVYEHKPTSGQEQPCMRYRSELNGRTTQCGNWGGAGGGINCWYNCNVRNPHPTPLF
jgi:hypothetical protein